MSEDQTMSRMARHGGSENSSPAKAPKPPKQKKKLTVRRVLLRIFLSLLFLGCLGFLTGVGVFWYYAKDAPELSLDKLDDTVSSKIMADDNETVLLDMGAKREKATADEIPQILEDAIISVEDRRFYDHVGFDPIRIAGAFVSNVTGKSNGLQGGSTLTQQLIKLSFFSTDASDQTLERKIQEAWMAVQLERQVSKQEVLTYYINKVYMANGYYGMKTAAEKYYGKELNELGLPQLALLAGMPQAPNDYDPYVYPDAAKERRDTVLQTMLTNEKITQEEYDAAVATPIDDQLKSKEETAENIVDQKIIDAYLTEVKDYVENDLGKDIYTDGLIIRTNLNLDAQKELYNIVNSDEYVAYPDDELQVAATLVDVNNGNVIAQIGGRKTPDDVTFGYNLATNTGRDFGSTVKPITDYAPAIEYLNYSTGKIIRDEPYNFMGTNTSVNNADRSYLYDITMRTALYYSRNVPAAKLYEAVETNNEGDVAKFLNGLGIEYSPIYPVNAISSNSEVQDGDKYGISSEKMAAAYAAFANGGTYYEPCYVKEIEYQDGRIDPVGETLREQQSQRAMEETTAYMITDMLKDVFTLGTGTQAQISGLYHAGKTGTSNYTDEELGNLTTPYAYGAVPDSNFVGYTKYYSLAIWTGYNDKMQPILSDGQNVAMHVYRSFMQYLSTSKTNEDWELPSGLSRVRGELYLKGFENQNNYQYSSSSSSSTTSEESSSESEESSESSSSESSSTSSSESDSSSSESSSSSAAPDPEPTPEPDPEPEINP